MTFDYTERRTRSRDGDELIEYRTGHKGYTAVLREEQFDGYTAWRIMQGRKAMTGWNHADDLRDATAAAERALVQCAVLGAPPADARPRAPAGRPPRF